MRLLLSVLCLSLGCATAPTRRPSPAVEPPPPEPVKTTEPAPLPEPTPPPETPAPVVAPPPPPPVRTPFTIEARERDANAARSAQRRGLSALKKRELDAAIVGLSECVAFNPERTDCLWELGWALFLDARWLDAKDVWTQVAERRKGDKDVADALELVGAQAALQERLWQSEAAPPPPIAPPPADAKVRLRAVGDVMLGTTFPEGLLPPEDGKTLLDAVKPLLEDADVTFVNLEGPLCDTGQTSKCRPRSKTCYAFRSPTHYADYLVAAGVDVASVANNHVGDFGDVCRRQTEAALDARRIVWSGPPGTVATLERNGLRIGLLAFHTSPATNYVVDIETARRFVAETARTHHLVIVSFHGGAEGATKQHVPEGTETFFGENRGDLRQFTHAVIDAGADLVLGHGPHVLRAMEVYKERLIAYSLGNFATYGPFTLSGPQGVGVILEAVLDADGRFVSGKLFPTRQVGEGVPEPDPDNRALKYVRELSAEDFPATAVQVAEDGTISAPPATQPVM